MSETCVKLMKRFPKHVAHIYFVILLKYNKTTINSAAD